MIYADNAAATPLSAVALDAMMPFLKGGYGNPSQPYSLSREPRKAVKTARETVARCINADADEIYFTSGGTEGDNWAIKGIVAQAEYWGYPSGITISRIEHHAVKEATAMVDCHRDRRVEIDVNDKGVVTEELLKKGIRRSLGENGGANIVSVMLANNEVGTVQDIGALCAMVKDTCPSRIFLDNRWRPVFHLPDASIFHTDAVAAVGHIPVDVKALGVDMLTASAHKFGGPRGVGFIYIKRGVEIDPYINGGGQERGMRAGTENVAGIVGMAAALQDAVDHMADRAAMLRGLEAEFLGTLQAACVDFIRNGGVTNAGIESVPGLVNVSFRGADGEMLLHRLDMADIYVSTGSACSALSSDLYLDASSGKEHISHVLQAMGVDEDYIKGTLRVSFGTLNKAGDGEAVAREIVKIL